MGNNKGPNWHIVIGITVGALAFLAVVLVLAGVLGPSNDAARLWTAGAMGLGLSVGLTTGLSKQEGSSREFMKFVSAGVVVPILGAIGAFLVKNEEVSELSTYEGTQLVEKTTTTVTSFSNDLLQPFAILGLFFGAFALLAVVGITSGILLRRAGIVLMVD